MSSLTENIVHAPVVKTINAKALSIFISNYPGPSVSTPTTEHTASTASNDLLALILQLDNLHISGTLEQIICILLEFCGSQPAGIDWALLTFDTLLKDIPPDGKFSDGTGPEGAREVFRWYIIDHAVFYQGDVSPSIGRETAWDGEAIDSSTVYFLAEEVKDKPDDVIQKMENLAKARRDFMVLMAVKGRAYALDVVRVQTREYPGDSTGEFVDLALDYEHGGSPPWSRVDCVACLLMLRGCAKSLLETTPVHKREAKKKSWVDGLEKLLVSGVEDKVDDFYIKAHAAVCFLDH